MGFKVGLKTKLKTGLIKLKQTLKVQTVNSQKFLLAFLLVEFFLGLPCAAAATDLNFSLNQSEYYFPLGQDAIIPLKTENTYGFGLSGLLSYTLTEEINNGNFQFSSSNTQSQSFSVPNGTNTIGLNFGTRDSPETLTADLSFEYTADEKRVVELSGIKIHFVSEEDYEKLKEEQKGQSTQQQGLQSSSQTATSQTGQNPAQQMQQEAQQQMEDLQKQLEEISKAQQQSSHSSHSSQSSQNPQQRLQNNQLSQDSSALKQQIQKELAEEQQMQQAFSKELAQNPDFQKNNSELFSKGYNISSNVLNPESNTSGTFQINYENNESEDEVNLSGEMQNGNITKLQKQTFKSEENLLEKLQENETFLKYQAQLKREGFNETGTQLSRLENGTELRLEYQNEENRTASIIADFASDENNTLEQVKLVKDKALNSSLLLKLLLLCLLLVLGYFVYKKKPELRKKKTLAPEKAKPAEVLPKVQVPETLDYRKEALLLLEKAKKAFEEGREKEAYALAGQTIRFYESHKMGISKEVTNEELLKLLENSKISRPAGKINRLAGKEENQKEEDQDLWYQEKLKNCLEICSLVEFARKEISREKFESLILDIETGISTE